MRLHGKYLPAKAILPWLITVGATSGFVFFVVQRPILYSGVQGLIWGSMIAVLMRDQQAYLQAKGSQTESEKSRGLLLVLLRCGALVGAYLIWHALVRPGWSGIPASVGQTALTRLPLLRPGQKDSEVFRLLGVDGYGLSARSWGSGSMRAWPTWYYFSPETQLMMRWDLSHHRNTLVSWTLYRKGDGEQRCPWCPPSP